MPSHDPINRCVGLGGGNRALGMSTATAMATLSDEKPAATKTTLTPAAKKDQVVNNQLNIESTKPDNTRMYLMLAGGAIVFYILMKQ